MLRLSCETATYLLNKPFQLMHNLNVGFLPLYFISRLMMSANRSTSDIWYHFTKFADGKAKCRYCQAVLSMSSGSTGNLRRHLTKKHINASRPSWTQPLPITSREQRARRRPCCFCLGAVAKPFRYKEPEPILRLFECFRKWFALASFDFDGFVNTVLPAWA